MSEACVEQCYAFATLYRGRGGILNALFKIRIIFVTDRLKFTKTKKNNKEVPCMLIQITKIYFNESDCHMVHSLMRIMTENSAKMTQNLS